MGQKGGISIVKPTKCTLSQIVFYSGATLYVFRTVSPSNIRRLYIQHQVYVIQVLWLLASGNASKQPQNLYCIMLYVQS